MGCSLGFATVYVADDYRRDRACCHALVMRNGGAGRQAAIVIGKKCSNTMQGELCSNEISHRHVSRTTTSVHTVRYQIVAFPNPRVPLHWLTKNATTCTRLCCAALLQPYFSANERCFSILTNQHKPNLSEPADSTANLQPTGLTITAASLKQTRSRQIRRTQAPSRNFPNIM